MKGKIFKYLLVFITTFILFFYFRKNGITLLNFNSLNLLFFIIFTFLMVYVHELGHVIAGLSTGIGINRVVFGKGREIFRRRIFGILVIFKTLPGSGFTFVGKIRNHFSKSAYALFITGGILLQLVITAPVALFTGFRFSDFIGLHKVSISTSFIAANLFMILLSVIPMKVSFRGFHISNDGMKLLRIPFMKQEEINRVLSAGKIMEAYELYEARKYRDAQLAYEKCMLDFPDSFAAHFDYSVSLLKQGKFEKAEEALVKIMDTKHDKKYDFLIYNNLAWLKVMAFTGESLKEADDLSAKAHALNPKISSAKKTRATALIALGRYDEGIRLLKSYAKFNRPVNMGTNHIDGFFVLAFAYFKKNDRKTANKYLKIVKKNLDKMDDDDRHLFNIFKRQSDNFDGYFCSEE